MTAEAGATARVRSLFNGAFALAAISLALTIVVGASGALAAEPSAPVAKPQAANVANLLVNGQFIKGAGNSPDHWRTESWDQKPDVTSYQWHHPEEGGPGQVEVNSSKPNDARWMQSLSLTPGWYYFSVDARAENVGKDASGASLSIMEDGITSQELKGTVDWTRIGLYLKVGGMGADVEMALRVGGYGSLNTGRAVFRNATLVHASAPAQSTEHVYDLDAIRKAAQPLPIGRPWTLVALFIVLGGTAVYGWQLYTEATLQPARTAAVPPLPKPAEKPRGERPKDEPVREGPREESRKDERTPARSKKKQRKRR